VTFRDALAAVRCDLWDYPNYDRPSSDDDMVLIPRQSLFSLLNLARYPSKNSQSLDTVYTSFSPCQIVLGRHSAGWWRLRINDGAWIVHPLPVALGLCVTLW